jgi:hypothetical protein
MKWIDEKLFKAKALGQRINTIELQNYELLVALSHFKASHE